MALDLARIEALCFDVDGTLSDTDDQMVANLANVFKYVLPMERAKKLARYIVMRAEGPGNFLYGLPDRFGIDDELADLNERFLARWLRRGNRHFELIDGTIDCLQQCEKKYPLAVITARGPHGTSAFLSQYDLEPHFRCVASALTAPRTKPYPDPIFWAAEQIGVEPENCLMIGDTTVDIRAGVAAGAQTVGVLSGFGEEEELRQAGADLILGSVADLPAALAI
ncbi:MAG: HAD family hydrolase [Chloroflexi bacterium]|nr:MAG: HAD family hydrolase [Chloroflexota bacterium]MBL1195683.1 HAD family hydrolase [Chloroflexota bacterium]NOH12971.1 HAD family hydrolase [Chloroflexota bacterium]